jgi:streptogramin lyase
MKLIKWLLLPLIWIIPAWCFAAEEISADKLVVQAEIPRSGDFMGFGFDSLWMMSGGRLVRVSTADNSVVDIEIEGTIGRYRGIAIGEEAVWIPDVGAGTIYKVDPRRNGVVGKFPAFILGSEGSIGVGEGAIWVTTADDLDKTLVRYNSVISEQEAAIALPGPGIGVIVDFGAVWVASYEEDELYRIDPKANALTTTIKLHERPRFITSGEYSIWVLNQGDGTVQRVDGDSGKLVATIETGLSGRGGDIVCGGGYVWITMPGTPVAQIDPRTNMLVRTFKGWDMGDAIRYGAGSLWVSGAAIHRIEPPK